MHGKLLVVIHPEKEIRWKTGMGWSAFGNNGDMNINIPIYEEKVVQSLYPSTFHLTKELERELRSPQKEMERKITCYMVR